MSVRFGLSGWSYDDWVGRVYPRGCKDTLREVARYVDFIELNSTFYRTPDAAMVQSWLDRTAEFKTSFTAKLPRELTHERRRSREFVKAVALGFEPFAHAADGRFQGLLAQFPQSFRADDAAVAHLAWLARELERFKPLYAEVRHASFATPTMRERLMDAGCVPVHLDWPGAQPLTQDANRGFACDVLDSGSAPAYFRLHGRNVATWYAKGLGRDATYDWNYAASEVEDLRDRALRIAAASGDVLVAANNHFQGKAMKLVLELRAALQGGAVDVAPSMQRAFPSLRAIAARVEPMQGELF